MAFLNLININIENMPSHSWNFTLDTQTYAYLPNTVEKPPNIQIFGRSYN